ncbi:MAG: general secretion pathway protein GspK [Nitrospirae bacterium]|nr:MAG: general secretion pathway protein GspK [Nitrospirota bacterium]
MLCVRKGIEILRRLFDNRNDSGSVLLVVLLLLVFIVTIVTEFAYDIYVSTSGLHNWQVGVRLRELADSAVDVAKLTIEEEQRKRSYTYPETLTFPILIQGVEDTLVVEVRDEQARFNINSLVFPNGNDNRKAIEEFRRLLSLLDLDEKIADLTADWIDPDMIARPGGGEEESQNRYFLTIDEFAASKWFDKEKIKKLLPYITVYGDMDGRININTAKKENIMALLPSIGEDTAEGLIRYREEHPLKSTSELRNVAGFENLISSLAGRYVVKSSVFGIMATVSDGRIRRKVEEVVDFSQGKKVLYRRSI